MKLLFDANLSPTLVRRLADLHPGSAHVLFVGLGPAPSDDKIWVHAAAGDFVVVTKDTDFYRLSTLHGAPPKVVWLRLGNCSSSIVETVIRSSSKSIADFVSDPDAALLVLGRKV